MGDSNPVRQSDVEVETRYMRGEMTRVGLERRFNPVDPGI
jgi:hypothetical protein